MTAFCVSPDFRARVLLTQPFAKLFVIAHDEAGRLFLD
jgi:hypothetical protein